jgi:hypothetical protein
MKLATTALVLLLALVVVALCTALTITSYGKAGINTMNSGVKPTIEQQPMPDPNNPVQFIPLAKPQVCHTLRAPDWCWSPKNPPADKVAPIR